MSELSPSRSRVIETLQPIHLAASSPALPGIPYETVRLVGLRDAPRCREVPGRRAQPVAQPRRRPPGLTSRPPETQPERLHQAQCASRSTPRCSSLACVSVRRRSWTGFQATVAEGGVGGAKVSEPSPLPEPRMLGAVKDKVTRRWGAPWTSSTCSRPPTSWPSSPPSSLRPPPRRSPPPGDGETEAALRYVRRYCVTRDSLRSRDRQAGERPFEVRNPAGWEHRRHHRARHPWRLGCRIFLPELSDIGSSSHSGQTRNLAGRGPPASARRRADPADPPGTHRPALRPDSQVAPATGQPAPADGNGFLDRGQRRLPPPNRTSPPRS